MKIVTNLISTPMGSILEKSNSIAKAMDNYNKFSTVKTLKRQKKINTKKVFKDMYEVGHSNLCLNF